MKSSLLRDVLPFILSLGILAAAVLYFANAGAVSAGTAITLPQFRFASSSVIAVTTSASSRLLATSSVRVGAKIQPINCVGGVGSIFVNMNSDVPATVSNGVWINGSSTQELSMYPNLPVVTDAVQAIAATGNCTVLVTEWRVSTS